MAKEIYFFCTKNDLINILQNVEEIIQLKYVEVKSCSSPNFEEYNSLEEYKEFGTNKSGNHQSESFLVLEKSDKLVVREVQQSVGVIKYFIDQSMNKNSISIWPGGIYDNKYLICGHVGTINTTEKAKNIFNAFQKQIKKQCVFRAGRYYVGEEAKDLYNRLRFITININQPSEYDLKI